MNLQEQVTKVLVEEMGLEPEQIRPDARFREDLGLDSLDGVELTMALEEEFGIEITDQEAEKLKTVNEVIHYLETKLQESKGSVTQLKAKAQKNISKAVDFVMEKFEDMI